MLGLKWQGFLVDDLNMGSIINLSDFELRKIGVALL